MSWQAFTSAELFENLPDPAIVLTPDGAVVATNAPAKALFEIDDQSALSVTDLLTQHERARLDPLVWLRKWADTPDAPELRYVYLTSVTRAGEERQLGVRVSRLRNDSDETWYLVLLRDLSSWEGRLRREREQNQLAQRLLAISLDAVLVVDDQQKITWANVAAHQLFEYPDDALFGKPLSLLVPEAARERHGELMQKFAGESVAARLMNERAGVHGLTSTGKEIPVAASIARVSNNDRTMFCVQLRAAPAVTALESGSTLASENLSHA